MLLAQLEQNNKEDKEIEAGKTGQHEVNISNKNGLVNLDNGTSDGENETNYRWHVMYAPI